MNTTAVGYAEPASTRDAAERAGYGRLPWQFAHSFGTLVHQPGRPDEDAPTQHRSHALARSCLRSSSIRSRRHPRNEHIRPQQREECQPRGDSPQRDCRSPFAQALRPCRRRVPSFVPDEVERIGELQSHDAHADMRIICDVSKLLRLRMSIPRPVGHSVRSQGLFCVWSA